MGWGVTKRERVRLRKNTGGERKHQVVRRLGLVERSE